MTQAPVVVTDGDQRSALAIVRSLGRAGHPVHVCSADRDSLAASSRHCRSSLVTADPRKDARTFVNDIHRFTARVGAAVLLPISEASLLAILPQRDRFRASIPFADAAAFRLICDKSRVLLAAPAHGIPVPAQVDLPARAAAVGLLEDAHFPVALKPCRSLSEADGGLVHASVRYAASRADLDDALGKIPLAAFPVLAQQRIEGPGFAISVLVWKGELKAAFAHRRIREKPPSGGVSVLRESIPLDTELLARSLALLKDFNWEGVAMVEYKMDSRSNTPYLMEINGRFWGSLQLAIDSGVDFPNILVSLASGHDPPPVVTYTMGVRSRWEWGDVDHLIASTFHSNQKLSLAPTAPRRSRVRSIAAFLGALASDDIPEIFRRDDPRPFLRETLNWFRGH